MIKFKDVTTRMCDVYEKKNHDYGNSFSSTCDLFGPVAGIIRLNDKMNRINTLINKDAKVKDESIQDTLLDLANYAIMTLMYIQNNGKNK